ncbi:Transposase [Stigmatella aurantiaca DW4/3-1]|uniref:Transposase n=1 Tax=Stigmatella aurantiaca (strain DW4/3-1) TaxID=378806 RepID=E3FUX7_STIAD|nr:Transposase [Stigmatella aurantiaca DW4/3-1]
MTEEVWAKLEPLLPPRSEHPLGCHNPRVPDRKAMEAILLVLRTGMQWQALKATGICHPSSAYRRFREWTEAGVFREFWRLGFVAYEQRCPTEAPSARVRETRSTDAQDENVTSVLTSPKPHTWITPQVGHFLPYG